LIPDQGTIPTSRKTVKRTQAGDVVLVLTPESASKTLRARDSGRGKKRVRKGERGAESSVAMMDPTVVSTARSRVAKRGENKAPARTFFTGEAHQHAWSDNKVGPLYPKNAAGNGPCVHPNSCCRDHTDHMGQRPRAALRITVKLTA
jgi:hypothetical protein